MFDGGVSMLRENAAAELCFQLNASEQLLKTAIQAECPARNTVVVGRRSNVLGIWLVGSEHLDWLPGGYSEPTYRANSVNEAAAHTTMTFGIR